MVALGVYSVPEILASPFLDFAETRGREFYETIGIGSVLSLAGIGAIQALGFRNSNNAVTIFLRTAPGRDVGRGDGRRDDDY